MGVVRTLPVHYHFNLQNFNMAVGSFADPLLYRRRDYRVWLGSVDSSSSRAVTELLRIEQRLKGAGKCPFALNIYFNCYYVLTSKVSLHARGCFRYIRLTLRST